MTLFRIAWFCTLGWFGAVVLYTLALLSCLTIIGIPLGVVFAAAGNRWLALKI